MKKNNTAQKTTLDVERISKALKEGTEKTLRNLIKEAIEDVVDNDEEDVKDEPIEDDSFEVQDVETGDDSQEEPADGSAQDDAEGAQAEPSDEEGDDAENDEWGELDDFKVGDSDYDFTGVDGDMALKVYNKLGDDDQIFVKKEEDGTYSVKDNETGAELVIELEPDGEEDADAESDDIEAPVDDEQDMDMDIDIEMDDEPADEECDDEIEIDLGDEDSEDDDEEELNEDLGYTDNYQSKDPISGMKMNEPADSKSTYSMDGGVPTGTKKPWAGKHTEKDYKETHTDLAEGCVCPKCGKTPCKCNEGELEEGAMTTSTQSQQKTTHTPTSTPRAQHKREGSRLVHAGGKYVEEGGATLSEAKARKILEAAKAIQAENNQIKEMVKNIKQSLYEAAVLNMKYGKIVNLLVNETTTKDEKMSIIERFEKTKTIKESNQLFESIKRELNESNKKSAASVLNEQISAESSKTINETPIYTPTNNPSLSLMERMDRLAEYNNRKRN